ncbi:hypothetical protein J1614_012275 [Plenodomus biglobosus]|nr:hypothetical protein J1614_012275 [Plenodomus biglobosus]
MPTKCRQADSLFTDGAMSVTIIPGNASPIIPALDITRRRLKYDRRIGTDLQFDDHFDSAKRMRYTPQPHSTSSVNNGQEVICISESMHGTAGKPSGDVIETNHRSEISHR